MALKFTYMVYFVYIVLQLAFFAPVTFLRSSYASYRNFVFLTEALYSDVTFYLLILLLMTI